MTEKTEMHSTNPSQPTIFFDADCSLCTSLVRRSEPVLRPRGFHFLPLQDPLATRALHLPTNAPLDEMKLLFPDGRIFGGADAVIELARRVWWAAPLWLFAHLPGARRLLHAVYRYIASHRTCSSPSCNLPAAPANANASALKGSHS